jgi:hypothetical protein
VSVTEPLDRRTILRVAASLVVQDGYLEKPYRYVPLFLAGAAPPPGQLDRHTFDAARLPTRPPEEVPDLRVRGALGVRAIRWVDALHGSLRLDVRAYADDWRLFAITVEPMLALQLSEDLLATARVRVHHQGDAAFWRRAYVVAAETELPRYRSVDRDLSSYTAATGSLGADWDLGAVSLYGEAGATYTRYHRFLYLDALFSLLVQTGARWSF